MNEFYDNLENSFYDENGSFRPLTANHGNISGDLAHLRDTYMESEREYFIALLSNPDIYNAFMDYAQHDSYDLFETAMTLQERLENGLLESVEEQEKMKQMTPEERDSFHMKRLEQTEGLLCLLYAAAKDKAKILELTRYFETKESMGRSR